MLTLGPGPFAIEDLPLPRRVSDTVSFVALGALLEGVGGQADAFLTPTRVSTADAAGVVDLGGAYDAIVAPAEDRHAVEAGAGVDDTLPVLSDRGEAVPTYHAQVRSYLPPVDAPVPTDFRDPPAPPAAFGVGAPGTPRDLGPVDRNEG
jgi:hypothetical protein